MPHVGMSVWEKMARTHAVYLESDSAGEEIE